MRKRIPKSYYAVMSRENGKSAPVKLFKEKYDAESYRSGLQRENVRVFGKEADLSVTRVADTGSIKSFRRKFKDI